MNLSVRDIARLLGVSEETIYRWVKEGTLPAYRIQEQLRFDRAEVLEWATARGLPFAPNLFEERPRGAEPARGRLTEALALGGVHANVKGDDRGSALRAVVDLLPLHQEADRALLLEMLLARENLGSTAMGKGIAIPHPRFPLILSPTPELLALCFLERPVDFSAPDGLPVHTLFLLISSSVKGHLALLSRLALVLQNPAAQSLLEGRADEETLLAAFSGIEAAMDAGGAKAP